MVQLDSFDAQIDPNAGNETSESHGETQGSIESWLFGIGGCFGVQKDLKLDPSASLEFLELSGDEKCTI